MTIVPPSDQTLDEAASLLRAGQLVAFPTETVYGLGADATNGAAVARIFSAKGRPRFNPLIVHAANDRAVDAFAHLSQTAATLAKAFWPGPLTMVLRSRTGSPVSSLVTAGLDTVAARIPSHPLALALIGRAGLVAAPSANRSGHVSATTAAHVAADLGDRVGLILDAGPADHGLESTIVDVTGDAAVLLRPGAIPNATLADVLGYTPSPPGLQTAGHPSAPGQLESHYAPGLAVRLNVMIPREGEALLAFGPRVAPHDGPILNLSPNADLVEAAANLFAFLRALDGSGASGLAVMPIPGHGLGLAINDRLQRAAAPRPSRQGTAPRTVRPTS